MQWTFICILLASIATISASDHGIRSKRDFSHIKNFIMSKIFGRYDTTPLPQKTTNYRLFRIPGMDNILVKAVPKVPVVVETDPPSPSVIEVAEPEPVPLHPSIAIVSKYLGTNELNDTLFALQGVKNLLKSGVLTANRDGIDRTVVLDDMLPAVVVEPSKIVVDEARRPLTVYPSLRETIMERYRPGLVNRYPNLVIPSEYSYKQVNKDGVMSYTAHDNQNVVITETKRPVPLPYPISYRIQDILSIETYRLPTSPVMHMKVQSYSGPTPIVGVPKVQVPYQKVEVMPSFAPSGYSYNQVHNDGSVTTYSGTGHVVGHDGEKSAVVITEPGRPTVVVEEAEGPPAPFPVFNVPKFKVPSSASYFSDHVHNDGSVTPYSGLGHTLGHKGAKPAVLVTKPGRPTVVVSEVEGPPMPFPVFSIPEVKVPSSSGYSYNHVHNDGSVTTYTGSGHIQEHKGGKPAVLMTKPGRPTVVISNEERPAASIPVFNAPKVKVPFIPGYSYNHVHHDGSITTYSGSGQVLGHEGAKPAIVMTKPGRPTVVVSNVEGPAAPIPVLNAPNEKVPSGSGYSYNHVHNDGSVTTYSGSGQELGHYGGKPAVVVTEPGRPKVIVSDVEGPPAPVSAFNVPNVKVPSSSGYSYNHVHSDGSVTTYSGSGQILEHKEGKPAVVMTKPGRPTVVVSNVEGPPAPVSAFNVPNVKVPSSSGYSYNHVHSDGSVTTYSGSGQIPEHKEGKPAVVMTKPGRPTVVVSNVEGPPAPVSAFNVPNVKVPSSSGYSYNHVHHDGSITTYSGSGQILEHKEGKPAVVVTKPGRPTVVVSNVEGPAAPIPVFNAPNVKVPSSSGYFYNHVHNDGSVTTYSGSGQVLEHHSGEPPVVMTEPGKPTVIVSDVEGPSAPLSVFNMPDGKVPASSGYLYNHVYNDGLVTTNSGSGQVHEHEEKKPAFVITEPGRPTVVVADVEGPAAPFPVFHTSNNKEPSSSGYFYNHVHSDGSVTTYSGHGQDRKKPAVVITEHGRPTVVVDDAEGPPGPFPIFNVPKEKLTSHSGFSYNHVHNDGSIDTYSTSGQNKVGRKGEIPAVVITEPGRPTVVVPDVQGPQSPFSAHNVPKVEMASGSGYSYNHVHNDGSMTTYAGHSKDYKNNDSEVVISEIRQPMPLPTFLKSRIENVAATAMAAGPQTSFQSYPAIAYQEHNPYEMSQPPNFKEQVKVHSVDQNNDYPTSNVPSGFSYKTVHEDGSVTSYTDAGVDKDAHAVRDRPILYPTGPAAPNVSAKDGKIPSVICNESTHSHDRKRILSHRVAANSSKFSYTTVREGGSSITYSGSGHVENDQVNNETPTFGNPTLLVTQTDEDNLQKVSLTPVLTEYKYKERNQHKLSESTDFKVRNVAVVNRQGDVKDQISLPGVTNAKVSEAPKENVFKPPLATKEPEPIKRPLEKGASLSTQEAETVLSSSKAPLAAVPTSTKIGHSFKPKRVYKHRVRTSTSSSSSKALKTSAPLVTTPTASTSTAVTSLEGSLSANPIVVLPEEKVFSFKQDRADGTSITVMGNKENKVSVVEEQKISPNRGDIPDSSF